MVFIHGQLFFLFLVFNSQVLTLISENSLIRSCHELFLFLRPPYICKIFLKALSSIMKPKPYLSKPQRIFLEHFIFDFNQTLCLISTFLRFDDLLSILSALGNRVAMLHFRNLHCSQTLAVGFK